MTDPHSGGGSGKSKECHRSVIGCRLLSVGNDDYGLLIRRPQWRSSSRANREQWPRLPKTHTSTEETQNNKIAKSGLVVHSEWLRSHRLDGVSGDQLIGQWNIQNFRFEGPFCRFSPMKSSRLADPLFTVR